jgi:putative hydrolase of the HAD superfamily
MMDILDPTKSERPRVIFFDAAGTLFHVKEPVWDVYAAYAGKWGWVLDPAVIRESFRIVWAGMSPPPWGTQEGDPEKLWWAALVQQVLDRSGAKASGSAFDGCFEDLWAHYARASAWELFEEVVGVLDLLKPSFRLGIISNFDERLYPVLAGLGLDRSFEAVTVSSHVRVRKPETEIFETALRVFGVSAEHALHVGDDPEADWSGAQRAGISCFLLRRPKVTLSDLISYLGPENY